MSAFKHITSPFKAACNTTIESGSLLSFHRPRLEDARSLSEQVHKGQKDSATGTDYHTHPARVADIYRQLKPGASDAEIMAALLHDSLEDGMILDEAGMERKFTDQDLKDLRYSRLTRRMVGAVSKPDKEGKNERSNDQKLADNIAFVENLANSGSFEDKLLKFCDALSNRERQMHEKAGEHDSDLMTYRRQKTDDTLKILYNDQELRFYFDALDYESLEFLISDISEEQTPHFEPHVESGPLVVNG